MENETRILTDLIIHPGEELADILETLGMNQQELAQKSGLSRKHINRIIGGKDNISTDVSLLLERVLGTPASFWNNLSRNYELDVARQEANRALQTDVAQLKRFPIREMIQRGWLKPTDSKMDLVQQLLSFFKVANFDILDLEWDKRFAPVYRKATGKRESKEALAVWIRAGQIEAEKDKIADYDPKSLKKRLPQLRRLTQDPQTFETKAKALLAEAGVSMVFIPHLQGTYANGAAYWLKNRPVAQLSIRGACCDIVYFSFFHELGHILLHSQKDLFIEGKKDLGEKENEANDFAADTLIPQKEYQSFLKKTPALNSANVRAFAEKLEIHPCIVVGRLQKENSHLSTLPPRTGPFKS